ncbi:dol-P-Glc:Glc(2)Man(9)GlcNAc(2)-PP-Dol alpha-1,2-glucosyltransferase-like isoform X2 [Dysidea avara]|uniref:dol-P-Glc:Glc(2)Man(9)GlcNAc(2)-PP-Dol alpha-1,2-glucosyltransferase-like isoform X2 n=1 Tax=Dysidea avara TaxID=196820 RepID=UPI00332B340D
MFSQKLVFLTSLHVMASGVITVLINSVQPQPYMDEIFHIPQVQRYCHGNYSYWDPMITTLPGLYLTSLILVQPLVLIGVPMETACSVTALRAHNIIFVIINFILMNCVMTHLQGKKNTTTAVSSFVLSLFPVCYFFTFLYYTDQGSLCCVLLSYWLSLCGCHVTSGMVLLVAVLFRQTNIIWAFFVAGTVTLGEIEKPWKVITGSQLLMLPLFLLSFMAGLYPYPRGRLFRNLLPYIMVAILFVMFIWYNGAIVVGDRSHHQAVLHLPQLFYFFSFTAFFAAPHLLLLRGRGWWSDKLFIKLVVLAIVTMVALCAVHWFMHTHPYLLADNRHYTFYMWKDLLGRHGAISYLLAPMFGIATFLCVSVLSDNVISPWVVLFMVCVAMATVPQKLIEFRYFIIPYVMIRLHVGPGSNIQVGIELLTYLIINMITLYLFLYRPFHWTGSSDWQRFMW